MNCYHEPVLRQIFNSSGLTTPDGMSVVWLLKILGHREVGRVTGTDLMLDICAHSGERGWRHFLYGGELGVGERLAGVLRDRFPGLRIAGWLSPPFGDIGPEEDEAIVSQINQSSADIVWVGISSPKQERWMGSHLGRVTAPVLVGVGAAFDFLTGRKPRAPVWMQRTGLEWVYRLASDPRRLWRRYAQYPLFAGLVLAQLMGVIRFDD